MRKAIEPIREAQSYLTRREDEGYYSGELRLRTIEGQNEFARIRRLHPRVDEEAIRP
jgi:hypothetical protein